MIYALIAVTLLITLAPIVWLWRLRPKSRLEGIEKMLAGSAMTWFVDAAGAWGFISVYLRDLFLVVFFVALYRVLRRMRFHSWVPSPGGWRPVVLADALFVLFVALSLVVYLGRAYSRDAAELLFPLRGGTYYVLQGGHSFFGSYFHKSSDDEKFELDIVRLNAQGNRAAGIVPDDLKAYAIYGDTVYSPCTGYIFAGMDSLPDQPPAHNNPTHFPGNYLKLDCDEAEVLLGHLMQNSLLAWPGGFVSMGKPLARVGNSGSSVEPHLHISAQRGGKPAAMRFGKRYLSLNSVIRTRK